MTLIGPPQFEPFGLWVEQLIAESTGKNGTGVVPIAGEPIGSPQTYDRDRLFVRLRSGRSSTSDAAATGAPLVDIDIVDPAALGAEFVRWEIATAVAGALLHINPFDEPNVQQAKDATRVLLDSYQRERRLPTPAVDATLPGGTILSISTAARKYVRGNDPRSLLTTLRSGDYFGLLAYLPGSDDGLARELQTLRAAVRDRVRVATMFGYGPRYLHSTGQLHKGGPNTGVFLVISATPTSRPRHSRPTVLVRHARASAGDRRLPIAGRNGAAGGVCAPSVGLKPRTSRTRRRASGDTVMEIGFIGLGRMGLNMVTRLTRGGHSVIGFDRSADAVGRAKTEGAGRRRVARRVGSGAQAAARSLGNGSGRRANGIHDRRAGGTAVARRHHHRRRQFQLQRRRSARESARANRSPTSMPAPAEGSGACRKVTV
jgi:hypothetical protein